MFNLLKIEFLKFRNRALMVMIAHVAVLAFFSVIGIDINATPPFVLWSLISMVAAAGFGILQMHTHKRINHWIYLLQRPLAPWKIATGLVGGGCLLVLLALVLPFVLSLVSRQASTAAGVELRHYLQLREIVPAMLVAYVYGCFLGLYTHKFRLLGLTLLMVLMENQYATLLFGIIAITCLYLWFKPDLNKGATNPVFIVLSELPLQSGMFWVALVLHTLLLSLGWIITQSGPTRDPVPDSLIALRVEAPRDVMLAALEGSALANAEFYRQQIRLGEVLVASTGFSDTYPERNQRPSMDKDLLLVDPDTDATWRFSHSEMLFKGVTRDSDAVLGWLGPQGFLTELLPDTARFASVPWVTANRFVIDFRTIYQLDWQQRVLREKFSLDGLPRDGAERLNDSLVLHEDFLTLFSDRNFYLFRGGQLNDLDEPLVMQSRLPLPLPGIIPGSYVYVMELVDGYLVGVLTAATTIDGLQRDYANLDRGGLYLYETRADGSRLLNSRRLTYGFSPATSYRGIVVAPGYKPLSDLTRALLKNSGTEAWPLVYHRFPPLVLVLAFCSMLVSGLAVRHMLKPIDLPRAAKRAWIGIAAFSGLIGLASFYFGTYRKSLSMQTRVEPLQVAPRPLEGSLP